MQQIAIYAYAILNKWRGSASTFTKITKCLLVKVLQKGAPTQCTWRYIFHQPKRTLASLNISMIPC